MNRIEKDIERALAEAEQLATLWAENKERLLPLIAELESMNVDVSLSTDLDLRFAGDKTKLLSVLRVLAKAGWRLPEDERPKAEETQWSGRLYQDEVDKLQIWVCFTSSACRQVQTGTRTVEEPIYKVICDE